jgi:hypothetical protein
MTDVDKHLAEFAAEAISKMPGLASIIQEVKAEGGGEAEVMTRYYAWLRANPEAASQAQVEMQVLQQAATERLTPLRDGPSEIAVPVGTAGLAFGIDPESPLVIPAPSGVGRPRLHPIYEAKLQERVSYDGDVPELRFGPLPKDGVPAVPVDTDARNPAAIGMMLEQASSEVKDEIKRIEDRHEKHVLCIIERISQGEDPEAVLGETLPVIAAEAGQLAPEALLDRRFVPDPVGYARGQEPEMHKVENPEGWALATLSDTQRHDLTWKFLSTTQGRKSATAIIRKLILVDLHMHHLRVTEWTDKVRSVPPEDIVAYHEWSVGISGPGSTQPSFSFIDTAYTVLARRLLYESEGWLSTPVYLEVVPVNTVDVRKVGWAARLTRRHEGQ